MTMLKEISMTQPVAGANQDGASARLKGICTEFESIFMTYMLKSMRSAMVEEGIMGNSHESKIMNAMFDENLALEVANGGGIGLGNILFERLGEASGITSQKDEPIQDKGKLSEG
jgi:flagellar protein FlgJ